MICPKCGKQYNEDQSICESCNQGLIDNTYNKGGNSADKAVSNYMVFSVLTTMCCCVPFGIVAIIYSFKVSKLLSLGDITGATEASKKAKLWIIVALIVGIIVGIIYSILAFMGVFAFYGLYY